MEGKCELNKSLKMIKQFFSAFLILILAASMCFGTCITASAASTDKIAQTVQKTGNYLYQTVKNPVCGGLGGDWVMYGLKTAKYPMSDAYISKYKKAVEYAVLEGYRGVPGVLHDKKYTEYSRVVFTYGRLGLDPTNVAGYNLLEKLADYDKVIWQGINGPIWALRALDSDNFKIPDAPKGAVQATRDKYVDCILDAQLADGGWDLSGNSADPDMTAMAVQALAPYRYKTKVKTAVDKALACMSALQRYDGGFSSGGTANSESCSQVIWALTLLGIDANSDIRFIKNGKSAVDALLTFYDDKSGGFRHVNKANGGYEATVNQMATEQAYDALASYENDVARARLTKLSKPENGRLKVAWENQSLASGYEVTIATDKSFKKNVQKTTVTSKTSSAKTLNTTFAKVKSGTKYYAKVRAYRTINSKKVYGAYSTKKTIKM